MQAAEEGTDMETITSKYIDVPGLNNTRDLGGMRTKDGRAVRPNMLFRCAKLNGLKDPDWFARNVGIIVDMRSSQEVEETPDPDIPGVEHLHLPIFEMQATGVTHDEESDRKLGAPDPQAALKSVEAVYARFVSDEFCIAQYRRFIRLLFEPREKAVLWHCAGGKDRTGVGALLIQELLGVSREDIMADYLSTNVYLKDEIDHLMDMMAEKSEGMSEDGIKAMRVFFDAREEYLLTLYSEAEKKYGGIDGFIRDGLGVSDAERELLRKKYLE
jgi:protein-tyrosine phosphatase